MIATGKQRGLAVLLLVLTMLSASLMITLTMHHRIFGLLKESHMQMIMTEEFWIAEGGLECAYGQLRNSGIVSHSCGLTASDIHLLAIPDGWVIHSTSGSVTVRKGFNTLENRWIKGSWNDL